MQSDFQIFRYSPEHASEWNDLVATASNGLFLFNRGFMDYHNDRFQDASLMVRRKGKLVGVFPANQSDRTLYSHQGLTYGGWILNSAITTSMTFDIFQEFVSYLSNQALFERLIYKCIPNIYCRHEAEADRYALFSLGAKLIRRDIASVKKLSFTLPRDKGRRNNILKSQRAGLQFYSSTDFATFHQILTRVLLRHGARPTHNLAELELLASRFPANIKLCGAFKNDQMLAGSILFDYGHVVHTQYLASSEKGKECGALDGLIDWIEQQHAPTHQYLGFGISTESDGKILNRGLSDHKDGHGGRGIAHDFYELMIE
nr:GNAT family N-acetyltransferase [Rhizobium sp. Khangiran2]